MSSIPSFVRVHKNVLDLSVVQNAIVNELSWDGKGPGSVTLWSMCRLFIGHEKLWSKKDGEFAEEELEARQQATNICGK